MTKLEWDKSGERFYEAGVDRGVLYTPNNPGVSWNGLISVNESPTGAEANPQYVDGIKYLIQHSPEEFEATIEAFTYPDEFLLCDGTYLDDSGLSFHQQQRVPFGLAYRTKIGNDINGLDHGYKIHLVYNAVAAPSERAYESINDSPEPPTFSWALTATPEKTPGFKPTAHITIDSTKTHIRLMARIEAILYGTSTADPRLPSGSELIDLFINLGPQGYGDNPYGEGLYGGLTPTGA